MQRLSVRATPYRLAFTQMVLLLFFSVVVFSSNASAVIRFQNRSLLISDPTPGATTSYTVSLTYNNQDVPTTTVGSMDLLFCNDPIPTDPCDAPVGLDVSNAILTPENQTGETGFSILSATSNHIVLTRTPGTVGETPSTYKFTNIVNPTGTFSAFSVRLSDYASTDASGPLINLGSIRSQVTTGVTIETQVPPFLLFCVSHQVAPDCGSTDGINYIDLGEVDETKPLTTTSQMAAETNAISGYAITVNGQTLAVGPHVIDALQSPTISAPGNTQFGINLIENTNPAMGADPDGRSDDTSVEPNYSIPNEFMYHDGDTIAISNRASLEKRYTVSYIINASPSLHAGVYSTTLTYICSGRF